jgi:hypothetical protein
MKKNLLVLNVICGLLILCGCGGGSTTVAPPPPPPPTPTATHLSVTPSSATTSAGLGINITVSALDASGAVVSAYSGTVHFTSSDAQAILPADTPLANGTGNFSVILKTTGNQTITATDTVKASITGSSGAINVVSNTATHLGVTVPGSITTRATFLFAVTALDAANNPAAGFSGTVHLTSTDGKALLPADSALTNGAVQLSAILETVGNQTITATDTSMSSLTGSSSPISVTVPPALTITSGPPPNGTVGSSYNPHQVRVCVEWGPVGRCLQWKFETRSFFPLSATGGVETTGVSWSWAAAPGSSLPPGLTIASGSSEITGTPTGSTGTYNVVITVTDTGTPPAQSNANYSITIALPAPPVVNTTPAPYTGVVNQPYSYTFTASGGAPFTWSESGALPNGLSFDNSTGVLSGTPTVVNSFPIAVTAIDQFKQSSPATNFTIAIAQHGFVPTGSMATARRFHTATLLPSGKVLIAGGEDAGSRAFASAELYDPSTGTFSPTGNMTMPRAGHTATLLNNGKVLVAGGTLGGSTEAALPSAELYDPSTGTFTASKGSMTAARAVHTATLLKDGRVLLAGGDVIFFNGIQNTYIKSLASAETYDPNTDAFTATGNMTTARETQTATLLSDGTVLIAGGSDGAVGNPLPAATVLNSAEIFSPSTGKFTATSNMTDARDFFTATMLNTGKVLIAGGIDATTFLASAELFDSTNDSFTATGNMVDIRFYEDATILNDGTVLICGGTESSSRAIATAEIYDPKVATFAATGSMIAPRVWHTATLLPDGRVLVTGGADPSSVPMATAELYE